MIEIEFEAFRFEVESGSNEQVCLKVETNTQNAERIAEQIPISELIDNRIEEILDKIGIERCLEHFEIER